MSDHVHIEILVAVREQLRGLEPSERQMIVHDLYESLAAEGRRVRLPYIAEAVYCFTLEGYCFFYRVLRHDELDRLGEQFGYLVFDMKPAARWIISQLDG